MFFLHKTFSFFYSLFFFPFWNDQSFFLAYFVRFPIECSFFCFVPAVNLGPGPYTCIFFELYSPVGLIILILSRFDAPAVGCGLWAVCTTTVCAMCVEIPAWSIHIVDTSALPFLQILYYLLPWMLFLFKKIAYCWIMALSKCFFTVPKSLNWLAHSKKLSSILMVSDISPY